MNVPNFGGGWFNERSVSTGSSFDMPKIVGYCVIGASMLANVGTGGVANLSDLKNPQPYFQSIDLGDMPTVAVAQVRTAAEDIARIREVFSPAISNLASTLGVSRQAVYNWLNGEQPKIELTEKLRDLAQAADVFAHEDIAINSMLLKRKFANGKSLFQIAQAGESTRNAALLLVQILRRETEQRARMNARFVDRAKTPASADFDLPAPNDLA